MVGGVTDCWVPGGGQRVGAMAWWSHGTDPARDTAPRPQPHLAVMTWAGLACLDCPATVGDPGRYWTRTGEPPRVTVTPSLLINPNPTTAPTWHGFLTDGQLVTVGA
jgi:hypothetical protein